MTLWAVLTVLVALVAVALAIPLVRRHSAEAGEAPALGVIRDQLRDLDMAEASGETPPAQAEAMRTELKRRLLAETRTAPPARPLGSTALGRLALGTAAVVAVGATALYAGLGSPELVTAPAPQSDPGGLNFADIAQRIEARLAEQPGDAEGWRALGIAYTQLGRFADAANAFGRAAALTPGRAEILSAQGEALVLAAGGAVPPQASELFRRARALDPADVRARYFSALASAQAGDREAALAEANALLADTPPDAPYLPQLRAFAQSLGLPGAPGPTAADVAAAQALAPEQRQAMVAGMVDRLADRLRTSPNDPEGWTRLMRARMVMGDPAAAAQAHQEALAALEGAPEARATITEAARALGVPGA